MRLKTQKSLSKLIGLWTFLLLLVLKGAFPKAASALSTLDTCAAKPECAAVLGSEVAPAVTAPTGAGFGTSILSTTTATGTTSTYVKAATGVAVVTTAVLLPEQTANDANIAKWHYWSRGVNGQAQDLAKQRYCAAYPTDFVCGPFTGGQGDGVMYRVSGSVRIYYHSGYHTYWYTTYADLYGPITSAFWEEIPQGPSGNYNTGIRVTHAGQSSFMGGWQYTKSGVSGVGTGQITVQRVDGQPDTDGNPPPLPWKDWSQEKRSIAVASLTNSDWQSLISSMPEGGRLRPGDTVNAPGNIAIPGQEQDDPNTPADERILRKEPGFFTNPGLPNTDYDKDGEPDTSDPEPQNPNVPTASSDPPSSDESSPEPYINNNPVATPDETRVGEFLDREAQADRLPRTNRVRGAAEISGTRSGDYRFIDADGNEISADLYQPQSGSTSSMSRNVIAKGNQAEVVVVELKYGDSYQVDAEAARSMVESVINTPDHGVNRVIVIKDGQIIVDYSR